MDSSVVEPEHVEQAVAREAGRTAEAYIACGRQWAVGMGGRHGRSAWAVGMGSTGA